MAARLYAAPIMLLLWAVVLAFADSTSAQIVIVRLVTVAFALTVSIHELSVGRRRRGGA